MKATSEEIDGKSMKEQVEKYIHWVTKVVAASQICEILRKFESSRSSKVINLGTNPKRICNFLSVK